MSGCLNKCGLETLAPSPKFSMAPVLKLSTQDSFMISTCSNKLIYSEKNVPARKQWSEILSLTFLMLRKKEDTLAG